MLLSLLMSTVTIRHSALPGSLGKSAPPGSDIAPRTCGPFAALWPYTPSAAASFAFPQGGRTPDEKVSTTPRLGKLTGEGLENFWRVLLHGENCAVQIPNDRFNLSQWYDQNESKAGKTYTAKAALIDGLNEFDNKFFGITDAESISMDPQHKLLLQCAYRALEDAGIPMEKASGTRTGVFLGLMNRDFELASVRINPKHIDHTAGTGSAMSIAANRISYVFNFTGPSLSIDCACSSSLVALHFACQAIKQVSDLEESLSTEGAPESDHDSISPAEEGEPEPKKEKQAEISMLMAIDEEDHAEEKDELKMYLADKTKVDSGPLAWWQKNEHRYPKLAKAAKSLHCIPSTSTPSERIFLKAGFIVKSRSSLLPNNVDKLVFLSHNMKKIKSN
ncbi:Lovastatin nonaketide synthase [Anabarilius grahami]|uniref:Lovastatin nonaketide synthase n=1 Tax=Anabarilius grahami TaxID=495550 RepID=A0A3N0YHB4_ANAGA|nr:Lovastatin nonaketide synthase [Anabarilius grahami]